MVFKYRYGSPLETDAVVNKVPNIEGNMPYFSIEEKNGFCFTYEMSEDAVVYGLGETVRGINKRGWHYISNCSDDPDHSEGKTSLYGAHNFIVIKGQDTFGVFVDYPSKMEFDIGYSVYKDLVIKIPEKKFDFYIITGSNVLSIVKEFRQIIGRSYIPPKWAFGYGQSRWSYENKDAVREVVRNYRENQIPLDAIYLDIDYMQSYKDFTIDENKFPEFPAFVKEMTEEGIHLVPIIDAGIKIERGYSVYEEGVKDNYFVKNKEGEDFIAGVWPGRVHFPDFLNTDARKWFGQQYLTLIEQGIEGFWNDMNEPAIFFSENHLQEVFEQFGKYKNSELGLSDYWEFVGLVKGIQNNPSDYRSFYHEIDGKKIRHDKVHNLYGYYMTRAAKEAFDTLVKDKRILIFSRASYIGMHRYGGVWTGDNQSMWSQLLLNIQMMPSLNMCGFLYSGADIGGFGGDTTQDLLLRWLAFGIFTPLMRNHSAIGTRRQEVYQFSDVSTFRNLIGIRYSLMPYIYSEFMKAAIKDECYFRPLAFDYTEDEAAKQVEDQLLVGESIMIAPVYIQNATGRYVYLPEAMKMIRMQSDSSHQEQIVEQGHHYIKVGLDEIVFFIRPDHIVPYCKSAKNIKELDDSKCQYMSYLIHDAVEYELYRDDGIAKDYSNPQHYVTIHVDKG